MTREYARAPIGKRTSDTVPRNRGTVTTILGGLTRDGLVATMTIEGGTDGDVFAVFLDEVLGPHLNDGDLVVMDNAGAHKDPRVRTILAKYGSKPVYLPPYSPELNPIELAWSKLKGFLRTTKARTVPALNEAIRIGMKIITPQDATNWIRHCGYQDGHAT